MWASQQLLGAGALAILSGCVTFGSRFPHPNAADLRIGVTTESHVITTYGQPKSHSQETLGDVVFDLFNYEYAEAQIPSGEIAVRFLKLEFRDGFLNAYLFASAFPDEPAIANIDAFRKLLPEAAFRDELTNAVGKPNGEVRCPSTITECDTFNWDVWFWTEMSPVPIEDADNPELRMVGAVFDELGVYLGCVTNDSSSPTGHIEGSPCRFDQSQADENETLCLPQREIDRILREHDIQPRHGGDVPDAALCQIGDLDGCRSQCDAGHLYSCTRLGSMHLTGICLESPAPDEAKRIYQTACDNGGVTACLGLGALYHRGIAVTQDRQRALELYRGACERGEPLACKNLGDYYRSGIVVDKDTHKAAELYQTACVDDEEASACASLAFLYLRGDGVAKDLERAVALSEVACNHDIGYACGLLASLHREGRGVDKDSRNALLLYRRACSLGGEKSCELVRELLSRARKARSRPTP